MTAKNIPVFVYGSLMQGMHNHLLLDRHSAEFVRRGTTDEHFVMYDLGAFPACVRGGDDVGSCVHGELYRVDAAGLVSLDRLEGYRQDAPATSLYMRVNVLIDGAPAFMYVMHRRNTMTERTEVPAADWRRHFINKGAVVPFWRL